MGLSRILCRGRFDIHARKLSGKNWRLGAVSPGVRYRLQGSVRRDGDTVEVNPQLISTETGAHLWGDRFDGGISKLGKLQFEVVVRLAHSLEVELVRGEGLRALRERPNIRRPRI
jgi:TolB-like protein